MTPSQEKALEYIKSQIIKRDMLAADRYEFKKWNVESIGHGIICVSSVVGLKDDTGTAAVLCRSSRLIFIGIRGGMFCRNAKGKRITGNDVFYCKI